MNKLPLKEKIFYVVANIGNIPVITLVSSYLSIFYVTVLGMNEFKVGTIFLIARIFDGVNDPFIGYFMDKMPESKFGKFRKLDKRSEGAVSALSSMITKIAMGLGGAIPMYILGATKTATGAYSTVGLIVSDAFLPCIFCVIAGIIFLMKYPITNEKLGKIHDELIVRRNGTANN